METWKISKTVHRVDHFLATNPDEVREPEIQKLLSDLEKL